MRTYVIAICALLALSGCAEQECASGRLIPRSVQYAPDTTPGTPEMLLYASIPPQYLADSAAYFARNGIQGFMMGGIMGNQESDVWQQPTGYTPDERRASIVGEGNALFDMCVEMNRRCAEVGITKNSVRAVFSGTLADWYDDAAWYQISENFRQCAAFAGQAGFAGVALDIEYVNQQYNLGYEAYQAPGYDREGLHDKARQRGYELMSAMLEAFPGMTLWQLPEGVQGYGPLAADLFAGMVGAMAERNAPGGYHLSTEAMYYTPSPFSILGHYREVTLAVEQALSDPKDARLRTWWAAHGSINIGVYPLGFFRGIYDEHLNFLGYGGRREIFGDSIVGTGADKAGSYYPPEDFRRQIGAIRRFDQPFMWIYCHGSVFWRMTPDEMRRYHGSRSDTMPVAENLDDYFAVIRGNDVLADPLYADQFAAVIDRHEAPSFDGFAPRWRNIGPFPCRNAEEFQQAFPPEEAVDLAVTYMAYPGFERSGSELRWREYDVDSTGYVNLKATVSRQDTVLAYSVAWVEADAPITARMHFGCNDYGAVFVNGQRLYSRLTEGSAYIDGDVFEVCLPAGRSQILVKVGDSGGSGWGFYLRLLGEDGRPMPGVRWCEP